MSSASAAPCAWSALRGDFRADADKLPARARRAHPLRAARHLSALADVRRR